jgi:hypothetical protein
MILIQTMRSTLVAGLASCGVLFGCSGSGGGGDGGTTPDAGTDGGAVTGNVVIADQYNNRVIELTRQGQIVWSFGDGSATPGPSSVVGPNDAERVGNQTLISGTGATTGTEPACGGASGCQDNRVILVDNASRAIVWQYGQAGTPGSGANQLNTPVAALLLPTGHVLITDQGNQRVIEVFPDGGIAWQYGQTGIAGLDAGLLNNPNSAERLSNGNTLIADEANNRVIEVTPGGSLAWQYPATLPSAAVGQTAFASRLPNGNTLITDQGNNQILEVTTQGSQAWTYATGLSAPTRAVRLANGDTLISDEGNDRILEVNPGGTVVYSFGQQGVAGADAGQLNQPYDAKVVGDFTGLTPPQ